MLNLIGFEFKKIIARKSTYITAIAVFVILALLLALNVVQQQYSDENGDSVTGLDAIATHKKNDEALAGPVTDERITADFLEYRNYFKGPDVVKDEYASDWKEVDGILVGSLSEVSMYENTRYYYLQTFLTPWMQGGFESPSRVIWRVDPSAEIDYSNVVRQGIESKLDDGMGGTWAYSQSERDFWLSKYDSTAQPIEYGYANGWKTALDLISFLIFVLVAICVGVAPVFASEYRERTDALILSSYHGKGKLVYAKVIAALLYAASMMAIGLLLIIGGGLLSHGADGANLPVQLISVAVPYALNMWQATLLLSCIALLVALGFTAFILFLSARWRSTLGISILGLALVLLPLFVSIPAYGIAIHIESLLPGMALFFNQQFASFVSYPIGSIVLDTQAAVTITYLTLLAVLSLLAARTFKRHQVM